MAHETGGLDLLLQTQLKALADRVSGPRLDIWRQESQAIADDLHHYLDERGKILSDDGLNEKGRTARLHDLAQRARERLARHDAVINGYSALISQRRAKAAAKVTALTELGEVLRELRAQEIRASLPMDDPLALRVVYERAVADVSGKSDDLLHAIETAPFPLQVLPGEVLDRGKAHREMRSLPAETRAELAELEICKTALASVYASARREVGDVVGDPIAELARGTGGQAGETGSRREHTA